MLWRFDAITRFFAPRFYRRLEIWMGVLETRKRANENLRIVVASDENQRYTMITNIPAPSHAVEKLAYHGGEVETLLGISAVTRWRLEKKGLLRAVPGIKHKLYSRRMIEEFLEGRTGGAKIETAALRGGAR
ncbi:MAG: hypothetical protein WC661_11930 [Opitutaceae bacterium]